MLQWGWVTLAQPVDVKNGNEVVQLVNPGKGHGLPDRALGHFPVSQQAIDAVAVDKRQVENETLNTTLPRNLPDRGTARHTDGYVEQTAGTRLGQ